jgi:hypothetical protein
VQGGRRDPARLCDWREGPSGVRLRSDGDRARSRQPESRDRGRQAGQAGLRGRAPRHDGGICVNTGTIPSKTLREAVLYLTGLAQREMHGPSYRVKSEITITDLLVRTRHVVCREVEAYSHLGLIRCAMFPDTSEMQRGRLRCRHGDATAPCAR